MRGSGSYIPSRGSGDLDVTFLAGKPEDIFPTLFGQTRRLHYLHRGFNGAKRRYEFVIYEF